MFLMQSEIYDELLKCFPTGMGHQRFSEEDSGKLVVLMQLLKTFKKEGHKVVLVSHYTKVRGNLPCLESMKEDFREIKNIGNYSRPLMYWKMFANLVACLLCEWMVRHRRRSGWE